MNHPETCQWWGEDVVPRIRWCVEVDGLDLACRGPAAIPAGYVLAWRVCGRDASVYMPELIAPVAAVVRDLYWRVRWFIRSVAR